MASNSEVAHAWAHNLDKAYKGSNMHHNDGVIKSYSTCIGQRLEINNTVVFILSSCRYSNFTSKHQGHLWKAIPKEYKGNIFCNDEYRYGGGAFIYRWDKKEWMRDIVRFGMKWLMYSFYCFTDIKECKKREHGCDRKGFKEMERWFNVTGCMTVSKLLYMTAKEFDNYLPQTTHLSQCSYTTRSNKPDAKLFRKFLQLMADNRPIEEIVDVINGEGTWGKYQKRVSGVNSAAVNRKRTEKLGFKTRSTRWDHTVIGKYLPVVEGSITKKDVERHRKAGDLIQWMLQLKRENYKAAIEAQELRDSLERKARAKYRLQKYCGMAGWEGHRFDYSWGANGGKQRHVEQFDYNGHVIRYREYRRGYATRDFTPEEYATFAAMTDPEERKAWITAKREWMYNDLLAQVERHRQQEAQWEEEQRQRELERLEREAKDAANREYILVMKEKGAEGIRQLWHEGFTVQLPWSEDPTYYNGNALMRVREKNGEQMVETSKGIWVTKAECARLWKIISKWHADGVTFHRGTERVHTTLSDFHISSFHNDLMTAGCHTIAFTEMEYIANELKLVA